MSDIILQDSDPEDGRSLTFEELEEFETSYSDNELDKNESQLKISKREEVVKRKQNIDLFNKEHNDCSWIYREYFVGPNQYNTGSKASNSACSVICVYLCSLFLTQDMSTLSLIFNAITVSLKGGTDLWSYWKKTTRSRRDYTDAAEVCALVPFSDTFPTIHNEEKYGCLYPLDTKTVNESIGENIYYNLEDLCSKITENNIKSAFTFTCRGITTCILYLPNHLDYIWLYDSHGSNQSGKKGSFCEFPNYYHLIEYLRARYNVYSFAGNSFAGKEDIEQELHFNRFSFVRLYSK